MLYDIEQLKEKNTDSFRLLLAERANAYSEQVSVPDKGAITNDKGIGEILGDFFHDMLALGKAGREVLIFLATTGVEEAQNFFSQKVVARMTKGGPNLSDSVDK